MDPIVQDDDTAAAASMDPIAQEIAVDLKESNENVANNNNDADPANDKMEIDDDDAMSTDKEDESAVSPEQAEILLLKAAGLKEEGNQEFKRGSHEKAARAYRRGVAQLKKLNQHNTGDEQVRALLVTLYTNLSTVNYKTAKYRVSMQVAGQAIAIDPSNVKALYRRAVAQRKMGDHALARVDLKAALVKEPSNTACQKELQAVKVEQEKAKQSQKKLLAKAFSGGGKSLYDDKEEEAKKRQEKERLKKLKEEDEKKARKQQWEDECVTRMAKGDEAITFEDWDKDRKDKEDAEKKAKEAVEKAKDKVRREQRRAARKKEQVDESNASDEELTPEECKLLRGYKKTADGRTTSYFTRELSHDETQLLGNIAPKRIESTSTVDSGGGPALNSTASKWNQAGTWEEKDTTTWCNEKLEKRLLETIATTEDGFDIDVTKVESFSGHASVAVVSGKKRYIFDFDAKLKYTIKTGDDDAESIAEGVVRLPDINSTIRAEETEVLFDDGWSKKPSADHARKATLLRTQLENELRLQVQRFVEEFNSSH